MKKTIVLSLIMSLLATTAWASGEQGGVAKPGAPSTQATTTASADMAEGEVRKVDPESKKLTIRHGEIKSLDMPGMTMVFQVKDPAMLDNIKAGDKVRFTAEKVNGAITVTNIEAAK